MSTPTPITAAPWNITWHTHEGVRIGFDITVEPHGAALPVCQTRHYRPGWRETWTPEELERHANLIVAAQDLLKVTKALVCMVEDGVAGMYHPVIGHFVPGVTDLEIKPDGSLKLNDARAAIDKAEGRS